MRFSTNYENVNAVLEYRHEMDVISAFTDACCEIGGESKASAIYAEYCKWAAENNEYKISNTKFGIELSKRFEKRMIKGCMYYKGVSISNNSDYSVSAG
ncbi:MAG: primase-like DNA-binding domain-containing protein [Clostridium sp.]|nr:primase-like DNA-binding domain-containing protein [Clostridium sp.]